MKAVIQCVCNASIVYEKERVAAIERGLVVLLGFSKDDTLEKIRPIINKIIGLRIFSDANGKTNLSVKDITGSILLVPNFTLAADLCSGNRPSFDNALNPKDAKKLFEECVDIIQHNKVPIQSGIFGGLMEIQLINDGPATFVIEQ